jgi:hypothetical protein
MFGICGFLPYCTNVVQKKVIEEKFYEINSIL